MSRSQPVSSGGQPYSTTPFTNGLRFLPSAQLMELREGFPIHETCSPVLAEDGSGPAVVVLGPLLGCLLPPEVWLLSFSPSSPSSSSTHLLLWQVTPGYI